MKYVYDKLVRDKIPNNINSAEGKRAQYRILEDNEYLQELDRKLIEESHEFIENHDIEELADVMEVIDAIMIQKDIKMEEVRKAQEEKRLKKGGFQDKIYLEYVEENERNIEAEKELNKDWRKK